MRYHGGAGALAVGRPNFAQFALAIGFNLSEATVVAGESVSNSFGIPAGVRHPQAWVLPVKGGGIKSFRRAVASVEASADGELGLARAAASTITITAQATGGLIASLTGTATITVNGQAAIVATLSSAGLATITVNAAVALAAEASMVANALITVDGSSGSMGLGFFTATTVDSGVLTPASIAAAVWEALAAEYDATGTMGGLLNTSGSGGLSPQQAAWLEELALLHGLVPASPLEVTATSRTAGAVVQTVVEGGGTVTVTRVP